MSKWGIRTCVVAAVMWLGACAQAPIETPAPAAPPAPRPLVGYDGTWYWMGTVGSEGATTPDTSQRYVAEFANDGTLSVTADCNRGRSTYTLSGRTFRIAPIALTRMGCAAGSQGVGFATQLQAAGNARIADALLELDGPAGTMVFSRRPDQRLAMFRCMTGGTVFVLLAPDRALVRWQGRSFQLTRLISPGTTDVRFRGDGAELSSKGPEVLLTVDGRPAGDGCTLIRTAGSARGAG